MKLGKLEHSRFGLSKAEREDFINSSLISSGSILDRLSRWEDSNDPERLIVVQFDHGWCEKECAVMRWYGQQSETRFTSIEHRKDKNGPFYHEFLLLKLLDGSVCRVERMGLGSRLDAIRLTGCSAKDLIQRFSPAAYETFSEQHPSTLIAELWLSKEFDILDVLAICYSIQHVESCKVYTLQRYNCYFLCWTVLSILARRLASWETRVTDTVWDEEIDSQLDRLGSLSPEASKDHVLVQLFTLLNRDSPRPVEFIFNELSRCLTSHGGALEDVNRALAATLWTDSHQQALEHGLTRTLLNAVQHLLNSDVPCMKQIKAAMGVKEWPEVAFHRNDLAGKLQRQLGAQAGQFQSHCARVYSALLKMNALEQSVRYPRMKTYQAGCVFAAAVFMMLPLRITILILKALSIPDDGEDSDDLSQMKGATVSSKIWMAKQIYRLGPLCLMNFGEDESQKALYGAAFDICHHRYFTRMMAETLNTLSAQGLLDSAGIDALVATAVPMLPVELCFRTLIATTLAPGLVPVIQPREPCLELRCKVDGLAARGQDINTAEEMQKRYIQPLIEAHANRVASHRLAAAPLVVDAIKNTMTEVWRALPPGVSGAVMDMSPYESYPEGISYF